MLAFFHHSGSRTNVPGTAVIVKRGTVKRPTNPDERCWAVPRAGFEQTPRTRLLRLHLELLQPARRHVGHRLLGNGDSKSAAIGGSELPFAQAREQSNPIPCASRHRTTASHRIVCLERRIRFFIEHRAFCRMLHLRNVHTATCHLPSNNRLKVTRSRRVFVARTTASRLA